MYPYYRTVFGTFLEKCLGPHCRDHKHNLGQQNRIFSHEKILKEKSNLIFNDCFLSKVIVRKTSSSSGGENGTERRGCPPLEHMMLVVGKPVHVPALMGQHDHTGVSVH